MHERLTHATQPSDLNSLNPIHIAGTKGKGSTAAFISSILDQFRKDGRGPEKIGLYTSPHLRFVRERIQINGSPLSEEQFAKYFFETWDRLEAAAEQEGVDPKSPQAKPVYFRFLTLMAFHTYKSESVDAAVIECGIGGAYDSTNIIESPSVTGITNLGIDHVGVLGGTLPEIAWHKAGIMKKGVKCFTTSSQPAEAKAVLEKVAAERGAELIYVDIHSELTSGKVKLGLQADFQKNNASLAAAIAQRFLKDRGMLTGPEGHEFIVQGLERTSWPGRCDIRYEVDNDITWCLDGGHTLDSIKLAGKWFAQQQNESSLTSERSPSTLIFNQQTRDAPALARELYDTLGRKQWDSTSLYGKKWGDSPFDTVIFCTNTTYKVAGFKPDLLSVNTNKADVDEMKVQKQLARVWAEIDKKADVRVVRTIEEAIQLVRLLATEHAEEHTVLVTGSLHLVGGVLEVLEDEKEQDNRTECIISEVKWC